MVITLKEYSLKVVNPPDKKKFVKLEIYAFERLIESEPTFGEPKNILADPSVVKFLKEREFAQGETNIEDVKLLGFLNNITDPKTNITMSYDDVDITVSQIEELDRIGHKPTIPVSKPVPSFPSRTSIPEIELIDVSISSDDKLKAPDPPTSITINPTSTSKNNSTITINNPTKSNNSAQSTPDYQMKILKICTTGPRKYAVVKLVSEYERRQEEWRNEMKRKSQANLMNSNLTNETTKTSTTQSTTQPTQSTKTKPILKKTADYKPVELINKTTTKRQPTNEDENPDLKRPKKLNM